MNEENKTIPQEAWYVDLNREEFVAFRLLLARVYGPLRMKIPTAIISLLSCLLMVGLSLSTWFTTHLAGDIDWVTLVAGVLVLLPGLYVWLYLPHRLAKTAAAQYERGKNAGMQYAGRLTVTDEYIEKAGPTATSHIHLDERVLFIENQQMMVFVSNGSPALVLPGRCLTEEMAAAVRRAADTLPPQHRRFIARLQAQGQQVEPPVPVTPEEVWVSTFTYTPEEYTTVLRGLIQQNFWRMAPVLTAVATVGALLFGWSGESLLPCIGYFLVFMGIMVVFNLLLPLWRAKGRANLLSPHDLTMQVRMDTLALRIKAQKGEESYVLWCDVDHVYDRDTFVEMVHNKHGSLNIPKRAIEDIAAFEAALNRCRDKK